MITYNRIINLIVFYMIADTWKHDTIDYIEEKYNRIFLTEPDIDVDNAQSFIDDLKYYKRRWGYKTLSDRHIKILKFCHRLSYIHQDGVIEPRHFDDLFRNFFTSYESISNVSQKKLLHDVLKIEVDKYVKHYDRIFKFLYIKNKISLNKK